MRNPRLWRNISFFIFLSALITLPLPFVLPEEFAGDPVRGVLFLYALMGILFGGLTLRMCHAALRAREALARGENVLARWQVDATTWRGFVQLNQQIHQEPGALFNELAPPAEHVPGLEVIIGESAVHVGEYIFDLPRRGLPEVTRAGIKFGGPGWSYAEFQLYYPGGGHGASGLPQPPRRTALRFPVPNEARTQAQRAVNHYERGRPGAADFFHGRGDGTDAEDLSECIVCGFKTFKFASQCPRCGAGIQSRRWSRRFGGLLVLCGLIILGIMLPVCWFTVPMILEPGAEFDGSRFSGTRSQAAFVLGVYALVLSFGLCTLVYGCWQVATGRRSKGFIYTLLALAAALLAIALML